MPAMAVYLLALGAAFLFGLGSVVQQRVAFTAPPGKSLRPSLLLWLVRQPVWLIGVGTAVVGNLLSGAALGMGSVALVQPLLVTRLLFALPLSAIWARKRLVLRDWAGMLATAGGLGVFILVGQPRSGPEDGGPSLWEWMMVAASIGALATVLVLVSGRLGPARQAPMLGATAGMLFALQSAFTHTAVRSFIDGGIGALLSDWTTYAVAVSAVLGTLLAQSAYEMAPLTASYPALAAVEPLAGIAIAVGILGSTIAVGPLPLTVLLIALAVMTAGIYLLATSPLVTAQKPTMHLRHEEERVADLERQLEDDLDELEEAVRWLEECWQPAGRRLRPSRVQQRMQRLDSLLPRVGTRLDRLSEAEEQQLAAARAQSAEGTDDRGTGEILRRYEEENVARARRIRDRAEQLRARARRQREPTSGQRGAD